MPGSQNLPAVQANPPEHQQTRRPMKPRHHLYPDDELTIEMEALARNCSAPKAARRGGAR